MSEQLCDHWSKVEWLHKTVKNRNIILKGTHSYYSGYYDGKFEDTVVRYLYGDEYSTDPKKGWKSLWNIDQLILGDYVQIAPEVKIIMGGNHTHNTKFISTYPFLTPEAIQRAYEGAGDTVIGNDVWLGMSSMVMPGVKIGNGVIVAANAVVTRDLPSYAFAAGTPAKVIRYRFSPEEISLLEKIKWWDWPEEKVRALLPLIQNHSVKELERASSLFSCGESHAG